MSNLDLTRGEEKKQSNHSESLSNTYNNNNHGKIDGKVCIKSSLEFVWICNLNSSVMWSKLLMDHFSSIVTIYGSSVIYVCNIATTIIIFHRILWFFLSLNIFSINKSFETSIYRKWWCWYGAHSKILDGSIFMDRNAFFMRCLCALNDIDS